MLCGDEDDREPGNAAKGLLLRPDRFTCRRGRALPVKDGNMFVLQTPEARLALQADSVVKDMETMSLGEHLERKLSNFS